LSLTLLFLRRVGRYNMTLLLNLELETKQNFVSQILSKIILRWEILLRFFLRSFENVVPSVLQVVRRRCTIQMFTLYILFYVNHICRHQVCNCILYTLNALRIVREVVFAPLETIRKVEFK